MEALRQSHSVPKRVSFAEQPAAPVVDLGCFVRGNHVRPFRSFSATFLQFLEEVLDQDRASRTATSSALANVRAVKGNCLATWLRL